MELTYQNKTIFETTDINTLRDENNNLVSVSSSDVNCTDDSQFLEVENKTYTYNNLQIIDFDFNEFDVSEKTQNDTINEFFNEYNSIKNDIVVFGQEQSHEYLFNSSKEYLQQNNSIIVNSDEYSKLVIDNSNLLDDLGVKDSILSAEKELYERQITALYNTIESIKNGAVNIIDSAIVPLVENNEQLKYLFNSLKVLLNQTVDYLIDNKASLTIKKVTINDYDIESINGSKNLNNTITYNYLNDEQYLKTAFNKLVSLNINDILSQITVLQNKIKEIQTQNKIKEYENALKTIESLETQLRTLKDLFIELELDINTEKTDIEVIKIYNNTYNDIIVFIDNNINIVKNWLSNLPVQSELILFNNNITIKLTEIYDKNKIYLNSIFAAKYYKFMKINLEYLSTINKLILSYIITRTDDKNKFYVSTEIINSILADFKTKVLNIGSIKNDI